MEIIKVLEQKIAVFLCIYILCLDLKLVQKCYVHSLFLLGKIFIISVRIYIFRNFIQEILWRLGQRGGITVLLSSLLTCIAQDCKPFILHQKLDFHFKEIPLMVKTWFHARNYAK